mgnify:CR=1 FL=1
MSCRVFVNCNRPNETITRLEQIIQRNTDKVTVKRAQIVRASLRGKTVPEISEIIGCSQRTARETIHMFNKFGFKSLRHVYRGGPKTKISKSQREMIVKLALEPPRAHGVPVNRWTLKLLAEYAVKKRIVPSISHETVRQILRQNDVRIRRTKTWKESNDPNRDAKWRRIKRLYRRCPKGGRVISFDPFGPIEIRPTHGRHFAQRGRVKRLPATYKRLLGVRHFMGWLDVHNSMMWGMMAKVKNWKTVLKTFKQIRARYPQEERIYIILDNASSHKKEEVKLWCKDNNVVLVFTATNASWMNKIECHFYDLREKVIKGEYPKNHRELSCRIFSYLRWRNARIRKQKEKITRNRRTFYFCLVLKISTVSKRPNIIIPM